MKNKCLSIINESCSANRESIWAIKHFGRNLSQKNAFLAKHGLKRISDLRPHLVLEMHACEKHVGEHERGKARVLQEEKKKKKKKKRKKAKKGMETICIWIIMVLYGCMDSSLFHF